MLLDDGFAPIDVARVLYLDEETIRVWKRGFESDGLGSLDLNAYSKRDGHLTEDQEEQLAALFRARPPKTTDEVRAVIAKRFDVAYSKSGAIKLMGRLGFCYKKIPCLSGCHLQPLYVGCDLKTVWRVTGWAWTFWSTMTCRFRNRFPTSNGYFPTTLRAPPTWRRGGGPMRSSVLIAKKRQESRSASPTGPGFCAAASAAATLA